jgi:anti-sigma factor RsiW
MSRHASDEELALYVVGELKRRKAAKIASYLAECARCTGVTKNLRNLSAMLSDAQFPPMPDDLSRRIQVALASESYLRLASEPSTDAGRPGLPARAGHARGRRPAFLSLPPVLRLAAGAAAAMIVAGGGYEIATQTGSLAGPASPSSSGPAPASGSQARVGPRVSFQHAGHRDSIRTIQAATNFQRGTFRTQVLGAMTHSPATHSPARAYVGAVISGSDASRSAGSAAAGQVLITAPAVTLPDLGKLSRCVNLIAAGRNLLLVELAKYEGAPATIVVVGPRPSGPARAYAVGTRCSASDKAILYSVAMPQV